MSTVEISLLVTLITAVVGTVAKAFGLPIIVAVIKAWTWLLTAGLRDDEKERRRAEVASDLYEHQKDARSQGYVPGEIALHILCRWLLGLPADLTWRLVRVQLDMGLAVGLGVLSLAMITVSLDEGLQIAALQVIAAASWIGLALGASLVRFWRIDSGKWEYIRADGSSKIALMLTGSHRSGLWVILAAWALLAIGIFVTYPQRAQDWYWLFVGVVAFILCAYMDYRRLRKASPLLMGAAIALAILVLIPGIGVSGTGQSRWIQIGPALVVQPGEVMKLAFLCYLAAWLASRPDRVRSLSSGFIPFGLMTGLVMGLIMREPDMGTALIISMAAVTVFFIAGADLRMFIPAIGGGLAMGALLVSIEGYRLKRLVALIDPLNDTSGYGQTLLQLQAWLTSGGKFGQLAGTPGLISPALNVTIETAALAIVGATFGFFGCILVILLLCGIVYWSLKVAWNAPDRFGTLLATALAFLIAMQTLMHVSATLRMVPLAHVPLPLVTQGGWAVVTSMAAIGIVVSIARASRRSLTLPVSEVSQPAS